MTDTTILPFSFPAVDDARRLGRGFYEMSFCQERLNKLLAGKDATKAHIAYSLRRNAKSEHEAIQVMDFFRASRVQSHTVGDSFVKLFGLANLVLKPFGSHTLGRLRKTL